MKFDAAFLDKLRDDWFYVPSLAIGRERAPSGSPSYVGVTANHQPYLRVELYRQYEECDFFRDIRCLGEWLIIGYGEHVHFINLLTRVLRSAGLPGYFGRLYTAPEFGLPYERFDLLVASASSLARYTRTGTLLWETGDLGADDVLVESIKSVLVTGSGEWDPPGGWEPFTLVLESGARAS
jgi:hypothetical protein